MHKTKKSCDIKTPWHVRDAIPLIQNLWNVLGQLNLFCALTGSVLYKGQSDKDLDIIIYPKDKSSTTFDIRDAEKLLEANGWTKQEWQLVNVPSLGPDDMAYDDVPFIQVWLTPDNKRVDLFWLTRPADVIDSDS